ncbi:hypothetical protein CRM75_12465 [Enterococcus faecium]|nr:hypothetical protein CRM75_12465 [Enterococcus faecium]
MTEVVSFKKYEGMYEKCFTNFCKISAYFRRRDCDKSFVTAPLICLPVIFFLNGRFFIFIW